MAGGLFGDLEIGKSKGYSRGTSVAFLKQNQVCYVSGNAINLIEISSRPPAHDEGSADGTTDTSEKWIPEHTHTKLITAESQIDAFAVYSRANIVAYSEQKSNFVHLVRLSNSQNGSLTALGKLELPNKGLKVQQLSFSFDGQYIVSLSDLPDYEITVWDWRARKQIASTPNGQPCQYISFNPSDSSQLCTSGLEGQIKFWKLKVGFRKYLFNGTDGSEFPFEPPLEAETPVTIQTLRYDPNKNKAKEPVRVIPFKHVWFVDHQLFASSEDGSEVYTYDPVSGACEVVFSLSRETATKLADIVESDVPLSERGCFRQIALNTEGFIFGGKDGVVRWVSSEGDVKVAVEVCKNIPITSLTVSPVFDSLLVEDAFGRLYLADLIQKKATLLVNNETSQIIGIGASAIDIYGITLATDGTMSAWDFDTGSCFFSQSLNIHPTALSLSSASFLAAIGTKEGYLRLYDLSKIRESQIRLVGRYKLHSKPILRVYFDPSGRYVVSVGDDGNTFFVNVSESFKPIGYLTVSGLFSGACWSFEEEEEGKPGHLRLYIATYDAAQKVSSVYRNELRFQGQVAVGGEDGMQIDQSALHQVMYRIEDHITDITILPSHLTGGRETFYYISDSLKLKVATGPSASQIAGDKIQLPISSHDYVDHILKGVQISLSNTREWLLTWGADGLLTVRSLLEPEKVVKTYGHDPLAGGVRCAGLSRDCRQILSAGYDGILRKWDWKYTMAGKRIAAELSDHAYSFEESSVTWAEQTSLKVEQFISQNPSIASDEPDSEASPSIIEEKKLSQASSQTNTSSYPEKTEPTSLIRTKISAITDKLTALIAKNDTLPEMERLDREEFIVDFEERDRLINEADMRIAAVRQEIEEQNLKHRIIRDRLKKECWDSMEVVGQSVKSFGPEAATGALMNVVNYPIRKRSDAEVERVEKFKRLRKIQLTVAQKTGNKLVSHAKSAEDEQNPGDVQKPTFKSDMEALLYHPSQLTTVERRRMQMALLGEYITDVKRYLNKNFETFVKLKKDEINKIEERNDRIASILSQLQLQETVVHPTLDDDEVPQRVIEVLDSEIKVEKFMTQEERKKMDEKRRQDEERARLQAEDNWRQRALMAMMGGKLEERAEQDEKVELVKPEWMNKNKEDMSEEEKKLLKEFEKKMAIFKEEQEKYRKALETELRKLQASITEITDAFDASLRDLFRLKIYTDQMVFQAELRIIKLGQLCLGSEGDEVKEARLLKRLEELKLEKTACTAEIPEIKKELEKCREEFEIALKRDKDLEKQFKKEIQGHDGVLQETFLRLFKKRTSGTSADLGTVTEQPLNPFQDLARGLSDIDLNPAPLDPQTDMSEGLPQDLWAKLVDIREKKILAEQDVYTTGKKFTEMQTLVQNVLDDSDRIRNETERTTNDLASFIEYKFQSAQNLETLFSLKQGQVEVPQAPLVTDYSSSLLLHSSIITALNAQITNLGGAKVDALTDMKNYRKGIHALEWEIKMLDFQAEDLVVKTRDIQLLRVTKAMQEFIRGGNGNGRGDEGRHSSEIGALEKRAEYNQKAHVHKLNERKKTVGRLQERIRSKEQENTLLDKQLQDLESAVNERKGIHEVKVRKEQQGKRDRDPLKEIYTRRRLIDLAKSQAQDIAILREEVERLRLRTYPAFHSH